MPIKTRISFKNRRFLSLKAPLLADETAVFCIKNHRFWYKIYPQGSRKGGIA